MIWGMPESTFLALHVALSLVGIATGLVTMIAMTADRHLPGWVALFLVTTLLTSVTGFPLPPFGIDPPRIVGVIDLALILGAMAGLYVFGLSGAWRGAYVICSAAALWFNIFVAITQSFQKIAPLHALAPTQTEWPFLVAQAAGLAILVYLGFRAFRRFRNTNLNSLPPANNAASA